MLFAAFGFIYSGYIIVRKLLNPDIMAGYSSLMAVILIVGGMIMLLLGLLGEYVGRVYICMNNAPQFAIRTMVNMDDENMMAIKASMGHNADMLQNRMTAADSQKTFL